MMTEPLNTQIRDMLDSIRQAQNDNQLPDIQEVQQFARIARTMPMHAEDNWLAEAEDFAHLADQLLQAVKNGDHQDAVLLMDSIKEAWIFISEIAPQQNF